jgi:hypothetical protein
MKRTTLVLVAILICQMFLVVTTAQVRIGQIPEVEYGDVSELVGLRRVFLHTESFESRERLLRELSKYPWLEVVGRVEDAEFFLQFGADLTPSGVGSLNTASGGDDVTFVYGDLVAYKYAKTRAQRGHRVRICWYVHKRQLRLKTSDLLQPFQSRPNSTSHLVGSLAGLALSAYPRLRTLPISRGAEIKAARAFIKILKRANKERVADVLPLTSSSLASEDTAADLFRRKCRHRSTSKMFCPAAPLLIEMSMPATGNAARSAAINSKPKSSSLITTQAGKRQNLGGAEQKKLRRVRRLHEVHHTRTGTNRVRRTPLGARRGLFYRRASIGSRSST